MDDRRGRFEAQVLPHLDAAYRYARWLARSATDADDVVQEATLRAYRSFDDLRDADGKAWLLTIVRNCHLTASKQQQRRNLVPLPEEHEEQGSEMVASTPDPESAAIQRDHQRMLERVMSCLPQEQCEVLVFREIEDMDYREIAAVTCLPLGTVMSRLSRARAALRTRWLQEVGGMNHGMP
jgi:RNA polymerase sigma factor (sigma-70 family)